MEEGIYLGLGDTLFEVRAALKQELILNAQSSDIGFESGGIFGDFLENGSASHSPSDASSSPTDHNPLFLSNDSDDGKILNFLDNFAFVTRRAFI
jgi:hypothetical protein